MKRAVAITAISLICAGASVAQEIDLVTDKAACQLDLWDRQEMALSFNGHEMFEIEYHCVLKDGILQPIYSGDWEHITAGYCEELGALYPSVFVFRTFRDDPGKVYAYWGNDGQTTVFHDCHW